MDITKKDFEKYFQEAIREVIGTNLDKDLHEFTFELTADMDNKRNYSSLDYYFVSFYRKHINDSIEMTYDKLFACFTAFMHKYPIDIALSLKEGNDKVICVKVDPRHRKPTQLKNQETGHPPFRVIH